MSRNTGEIETKSDENLDLGSHVFDLARKELKTAGGILVALRAQSADVFAVLGRHPNEIVAKDTLIEAVWGDTFVTDDSLVQCIGDIRRALGKANRGAVETFPKKGYRLNIPSLIKDAVPGIATEARDDGTPARPVIAVMAFEDMSNGANQGYLSDAICEGIITELTRFREFSVVARNSSFKFRGTATDVRVIAQDLGLHYLLEGSQQIDGDRLRVTAQLIDAQSGKHIWAEVYDRDLADVFSMQAEIIRSITSSVGLKVAYNPPPAGGLKKLSALKYHLEARTYVRQTTKEAAEKARVLNRKAIEADPTSPYGHIGMAFVHIQEYRWDWADGDRTDALSMAVEHAEKALSLDSENYSTHYVRGYVHMQAGELDWAMARLKRSLELNPSAINVMLTLAQSLVFKGRVNDAFALTERALEITPYFPDWLCPIHAQVLWAKGDYEAALAVIRRISKLTNYNRMILIATYACLGRQAEAEAAVTALLREQPHYSISIESDRGAFKYEDTEALERWLGALRKAGLPE